MLPRWMNPGLVWAASAFAGLSIVLVVVNALLSSGNQSAQAQFSQRQQFISQTAQLTQVYQALLQTLGNTVIATKDERLKTLLAQFGITITPSAAPADPAAKPAGGK